MDTSPPLFPCGDHRGTEPNYGVSLRDWFASHAPVTWKDALTVCGWSREYMIRRDSERVTLFAVMALLRYEYADAMLGYRSQPTPATDDVAASSAHDPRGEVVGNGDT